jgi:nucleoside 2-deoxyribosyltransferase
VDTRQNVLADVVRGIADADLVVADLTTINANVFYELGLAHAMGIPTVLVAHQDAAEEIPFDLRQYRTEWYDTHFQRAGAIVEALHKLGVAHAQEQIVFGSPVSDYLPGADKPAARARRKVPFVTSCRRRLGMQQ